MHAFSEILIAPPAIEILRADEAQRGAKAAGKKKP
jgi:hypothetical protein